MNCYQFTLMTVLSCAGYVKAHDWSFIVTTVAIWATRDTLPSSILHVFFRYCDCVRRLLNRRIDLDALTALDIEVAECLSLVEARFPQSDLTIMFHLLLHAVFFLRLWGPFSSYWMYPLERFLGFLANAITNRARPEANLTRFYLHFATARSHRADIEAFFASSSVADAYQALKARSRKLDTDKEVMTPKFSAHLARLDGKRSTVRLSSDQRKHVVRLLRLVCEEYNELCTLYDSDRAAHADRKGHVPRDFPDMPAWSPSDRSLTADQQQWLLGPPNTVMQTPRCVVGGVEFRSASAERKQSTRNSYFAFQSIKAGTMLIEYGRLLDICEVDIADHTVLCARVEIYKSAKDEQVCERQLGKRFTLTRVDTTKIWRDRCFLPLDCITSKIILAPADSRIDRPADDRLRGVCYVLPFIDCVRPANVTVPVDEDDGAAGPPVLFTHSR